MSAHTHQVSARHSTDDSVEAVQAATEREIRRLFPLSRSAPGNMKPLVCFQKWARGLGAAEASRVPEPGEGEVRCRSRSADSIWPISRRSGVAVLAFQIEWNGVEEVAASF